MVAHGSGVTIIPEGALQLLTPSSEYGIARFGDESPMRRMGLVHRVSSSRGADFAQLARDNSTCPSGRSGGDLGSFGPGQMVKEFDTVVFSAPVGVVQGPVKTQFGYHLLEVTSRQD